VLTARLAVQELRQQLRGPVFHIVAGVSLLMVIGAAVIDTLRIDAVSNLGSGRELVVGVHLVWTLFYLFTAAAFVGEAVTRDAQTGFAPLVRATPVPRPAYMLGRFGGAAAALLLCFLTIPIGLLAARLLPAASPDWVAPVLPSTYALALLALAVPNLLLASALFLALATITRSMNGCLVGAVALLSLYGLRSEDGGIAPLFEPFGFVAAQALQGGDPGPLIANRALWLSVALLLLLVAVWLDARTPQGIAVRKTASLLNSASVLTHAPAPTNVRQSEGLGVAGLQLLGRTRHHVAEIVGASTFRVLLLLGLASCLGNLWPAVQAEATVSDLLATLIRSFALVPVVVVLFFAGELHWSDRTHRMDRIVDATPVSRAILLLAQLLALAIILLTLAVVTGLAIPALLIATGRDPDFTSVLGAYVLPKTYDWLLLGVLAWFLQALSPNKFAGWGYLVLFLIGTLALDQVGLTSPAFHYGRYPEAPLPPSLTGEDGAESYRAAWGALAAVMVACALMRGRLRLGTLNQRPEPPFGT
jgi:hypothetical protein